MGTLWWLVIFSVVGEVLSLCPTNTQYNISTFGGNCKYRCHCVGDVQCDQASGECPSGCEDGWMGPACQYRNIAMNQTSVSQHGNAAPDTMPAINAVDRNMATCSKTNPSLDGGEQYWWIQLDRVYYIVGLLIHLPPGETLGAFRIEAVNMTSFNSDDVRLCVQYSSGPGTNTIEVMCLEPMLASVLRVVHEDVSQPLSLCEVQIYGGRHISFNQNTTQQSTLTYRGHTWYSSLAVDGTGAVTTQNEGHAYTCSATDDGAGERWWQLDLLAKYRIEDIYVFSRLDSPGQTAGFNLTIDSEYTYNDVSSGIKMDYLPRTLNIIEPVDGQSIRLKRQIILVLCEVIVYGECLPNYCGLNCTDVCMCSSVTTGTSRLTGVCPHGCSGRWTGTDGRCNKECSTTEWGPYCNNTCGHCANNGTCDVKTGMCPQGCRPSWKPGLCANKCDDGWWGSNCTNTCGNCTDGTPCDKINGICAAGCHPGYKPLLCTEECDPGMYGDNCSSVCGNCTKTNEMTSCRPDTGVCPGGCQPGHKPPNCHDECDDGWWGSNCTNTCGNCTDGTPCDKINGICAAGCHPGYKPLLCTEECDPGTYGDNCSSVCGNCTETNEITSCRPDTGVCPGGCQPGHKPPNCHDECDDSWWGSNCSSSCGNCTDDGPCNKKNGTCPGGCLLGYQPPFCKEECTPGSYGLNCTYECGNCTETDVVTTCRPDTGDCPAGCPIGLQPLKCQAVCREGSYGNNCNSSCANCSANTVCHHVTGVCPQGCQDGYQGDTCHDECDNGTFGGNCSQTCGNCSGVITCDHVTGRCPSGCDPGFKGDKCSEHCSPGFYGQNCSAKCGQCSEDETSCNHVTGVCSTGCLPGYNKSSSKCDIACNAGHFGMNCNGTCGACADPKSCKREDGLCENGCVEGYQGEMCLQKLVAGDSSTAGIIGGTVAAVLIVVIAAVGLFLYRRFHQKDNQAERVALPMNSLPNEGDASPGKSELLESGAYNSYKVEELDSHSHRTIPVSELRRFVSSISIDPEQLYTDYSEIPRVMNLPSSDGKAPDNVGKNKYKDILPYDMNRVKLQTLPGIENSDYINASYIQISGNDVPASHSLSTNHPDYMIVKPAPKHVFLMSNVPSPLMGYNNVRSYIAAQGPLERTVHDFWRMLWEQDVSLIVMLTNCVEMGKMKCIQYWPEHEHVTYGDIEVTLLSQNVYSEYTVSHLQCGKGRQNRRIVQYHYTAWPDKDVPDTPLSLVNFWRQVRASDILEGTQWLVHCSAGVGRTGTFITLDYLFEKGRRELSVNVYECVKALRQQRSIMVQTQDQYVFIHLVLTEALLPIGTVCSVDQFPDHLVSLTAQVPGQPTRLFQEYQELEATRMGNCSESEYGNINNDLDMVDCLDSFKEENVAKSRNARILPPDTYRAKLTYPLEGYNDYINAVTIPTYQRGGGLLLTQLPLSHTIVDFLRLLVSYRVKVIVLLEDQVHEDAMYWPALRKTLTEGPFTVETATEVTERLYIQRTLRCTVNDETREVCLLHYTGQWMTDVTCPADQHCLLDFLTDVYSFLDANDLSSPLIVQCLDGSAKSGLFAALLLTLERVKCNNEVAVAESVRNIRQRRRQVIHNLEQYQHCYDAAKLYIDSMQVYANI